jgi:hypothetical protein
MNPITPLSTESGSGAKRHDGARASVGRPESAPEQPAGGASDGLTGEADDTAPLKVVIVYDRVSAGQRAMSMLTRLLEPEMHLVNLSRSLWRLDLVHDPEYTERIIADVTAADLLILSTYGPPAVPSAIDHWVSAFLSKQRRARTAILSLFGHLDNWSISIQEVIDASLDLPPSGFAQSVRVTEALPGE